MGVCLARARCTALAQIGALNAADKNVKFETWCVQTFLHMQLTLGDRLGSGVCTNLT